MFEIRPFDPCYIPEAAVLFASCYNESRQQLPLIPPHPSLAAFTEEKLGRISRNPGFAAFSSGKLVGYMIELFTADNFMSRPTAFVIELYPCAAVSEDREEIYQLLYKAMSRLWIERGFYAHQYSFFATDDRLSKTFFRLTFGMTHFQLFRPLDIPAGEIPDIDIRYLTSEDLIREIDAEHHAYYPNPPLFWIAHDSFHEPEKDRIKSGEAEIVAAFVDGRAAAYFVLSKGTAETEVLAHEGNGQIKAAYARPEYRKMGIGKALLAESVRWAKRSKLERLYVEGESANIYGGNFWCKHFLPAEFNVRRCVDERIRTTMFTDS